ncbi:hypothetical protein [Deinococcus maricopensis]|uniref:Segregation and condensation protein A n=1 Tax=Deinococcus maricopensis (strain DSM 21211 / LMG 22137 / NRRL B-23946 / LB-34) TaxID=709986 RepID=E8U7F3_DEIML|nr:hypothetical protein [Deinococcus maricopensis]ADV66992.1 hypothetical protein Deima_1342 [Deinococcus maricopensis DSM 21211]
MTPPASPPEVFVVTLPAFQGSLADLALTLRAGRLQPTDVPLLDLTRRVLAWASAWQAAHPEAHADLLPTLAQVIALKARLLLPQPEPDAPADDWADDDPLDDVTAGVEALADLEALVQFLAARRREREGLIPARPLDLGLPRRERRASGQRGLEKLLKAARSAVRDVHVPLLSRERLTLAGALGALRSFAARLTHFQFHTVPVQDWGERTTYFSALLEGVKGGELDAQQEDAYSTIHVQRLPGLRNTDADDAPEHARSA